MSGIHKMSDSQKASVPTVLQELRSYWSVFSSCCSGMCPVSTPEPKLYTLHGGPLQSPPKSAVLSSIPPTEPVQPSTEGQ